MVSAKQYLFPVSYSYQTVLSKTCCWGLCCPLSH